MLWGIVFLAVTFYGFTPPGYIVCSVRGTESVVWGFLLTDSINMVDVFAVALFFDVFRVGFESSNESVVVVRVREGSIVAVLSGVAGAGDFLVPDTVLTGVGNNSELDGGAVVPVGGVDNVSRGQLCQVFCFSALRGGVHGSSCSLMWFSVFRTPPAYHMWL